MGALNAQVEVQYFENPDRLLHLNKIDGIPFFGKNTNQLDFNISDNDSQIHIFNGNNFELKLNLNKINDSLNNAFLFDLWGTDDNYIVFCLTINNKTSEKHLTILQYDNDFKNLIGIDLFPVDKLRTLFGQKTLRLGDKTIWYFLEFDEVTNEGRGIVRVAHENGKINWTRTFFGHGITGLILDDVYVEENKEILILNTSNSLRKFLVFDTELNFQYSGLQNSEFQGVSHVNPTTIILGGQQGNYTLLERFFHDGRFILIKREMILNSENIGISDDYTFLFPEDNSYFIQKYQKEDYTIFHYSKSSLDLSSDSFGYRIIFFDKFGKLENQIEVHEETSIGLGFINFYNNNTIAFGNGSWLYPGSHDPFIIKLTLSDTTTSTEDIWQEEAPSLLLSNLIVDGQLRFIHSEINLNRITVYDISGRQLISGLSTNSDISFLPAGHYVVRYDGESGVITERFVMVE